MKIKILVGALIGFGMVSTIGCSGGSGGGDRLEPVRSTVLSTWGWSVDGQSLKPIRVEGLPSDRQITGMDAGRFHTAVLLEDGTVWTWGLNKFGELGDGSTDERAEPMEVIGLPKKAIQVAAGAWFTLALLEDGTVWAWGLNAFGQLGVGDNINRTVPARVKDIPIIMKGYFYASKNQPPPAPRVATSISAGENFACAVMTDGSVLSWGNNAFGQLGDTTYTNSNRPRKVKGMTAKIQSIDTGNFHTLALDINGVVTAWGSNVWGQLGDGSHTQSNVPVTVLGTEQAITHIAAGYLHSLALREDNTLFAWGHGANGQTGTGLGKDSTDPQEVLSLSPQHEVATIAAAASHTLIVTAEGKLLVCGTNYHGQLGLPDVAKTLTPIPIEWMSGVTAVAAGNNFSLAIHHDYK